MGETTGGPATPEGPGADARAGHDLIDQVIGEPTRTEEGTFEFGRAVADDLAAGVPRAELSARGRVDADGTVRRVDPMDALASFRSRVLRRRLAVFALAVVVIALLLGLTLRDLERGWFAPSAGQAPDQAGAAAPVPSGVAPSPSAVLAPSPSPVQASPSEVAPSPSPVAPSPSAEAPSPSAVAPSPSSEQVADDCPGTLLGSLDTDSVLASSGGSAAARKAFEISFTKDCVSLKVDPAGLAAGEEDVTGTFLLVLDETDITSAASRSCVISIVWAGTLNGVYSLDGTRHVASGIGTGTITRSMTDGCTAISAANRRPVSTDAEDITWQVSGDGQAMAGEFVVVPSKGDSPLLWKVEIAAR
jgi:hypothetical protein